MARYCPLFSGSSGNCTYVGTASDGVLVDAGVSARRIENALRQRQIDPAAIRAIFITHEHSDHIAGVRVLVNRYHIPVYASRGTRAYLIAHGMLAPDAPGEALEPGTRVIADMEVRAFHTPHDAVESMGFAFHLSDYRRIAVATDMGEVTDEIRDAIAGCDLAHIESNHEIPMLQNGP
ncbi:MAG: MBL fold metallo-hydrolase, partial [Acutalibacteraceae bacterium]